VRSDSHGDGTAWFDVALKRTRGKRCGEVCRENASICDRAEAPEARNGAGDRSVFGPRVNSEVI
jgi:hypothetical protein